MLQQLLKPMIPILVGLTVGLALAPVLTLRLKASPASASSTHALTITQVRSLATLLTCRMEVADVNVTRLGGYLGGVEAALLLRGHVDLGIDMEQAELVAMNKRTQTGTLRLPKPHVVSAAIDHEQTRIVALNYDGLWRLNPQSSPTRNVLERALAGTEAALDAHGQERVGQERAKQQAEVLLTQWGRSLGWTLVVDWK